MSYARTFISSKKNGSCDTWFEFVDLPYSLWVSARSKGQSVVIILLLFRLLIHPMTPVLSSAHQSDLTDPTSVLSGLILSSIFLSNWRHTKLKNQTAFICLLVIWLTNQWRWPTGCCWTQLASPLLPIRTVAFGTGWRQFEHNATYSICLFLFFVISYHKIKKINIMVRLANEGRCLCTSWKPNCFPLLLTLFCFKNLV